MERFFLGSGALLGMLAVALGAFAAHGLKGYLDAEQAAWWQTAVQYQFYHALAMLAVAWAVGRWPVATAVWSGWLFLAGVLIFCGMLYAMALGAPRWLGAITPIGGTSMIVAWLLLAVTAWRAS